MGLLRAHRLATAIVALALAAFAAAFAFARPTYRPSVMPEPPSDLPYTAVTYSTRDAVRAFAAIGVRLSPRSKSPAVTTVGNAGDALEVDVFGDPQKVEAAGFHDYLPSNGRYVHFPRTCGTSLADAERWRGNVRVIVSCGAAAVASAEWLRRADRALALLT